MFKSKHVSLSSQTEQAVLLQESSPVACLFGQIRSEPKIPKYFKVCLISDGNPPKEVDYLYLLLNEAEAEMANKDGTWLREISSCCCLTTAGKTRQLLLNKIYIPILPSL